MAELIAFFVTWACVCSLRSELVMGLLTTKQLRQTEAGRRALGLAGDAPKVTRRPSCGPKMNATEEAYNAHLRTRHAAGEVLWWAFNAVRLLITDGDFAAFYKPDFTVIMWDGTTQYHETKGFEREAAMLRLKVAAGIYTFAKFVLVKRYESAWSYEFFSTGKVN